MLVVQRVGWGLVASPVSHHIVVYVSCEKVLGVDVGSSCLLCSKMSHKS